MCEPMVIQVDEKDNEVGLVPKMDAHRKGVLHRAISILIFDSHGNWMLQKRADGKYHSAGLWTNACCSHPLPEETDEAAANRRLYEEMKLSCDLEKKFSFLYKAEFENGLIEHELDHVFYGICDDMPDPDPAEVSEWRMISPSDLALEIAGQPENFTEWFKIVVPKVVVSLASS